MMLFLCLPAGYKNIFIMFLDFAKGVREFYSDKRIILLCESDFGGLVEDTKLFDEIIVVDKKIHNSFFSLMKLVRRLKKMQVDVFINESALLSFFRDIIARSVNAAKKYLVYNDAVRSSEFKLKMSRKWYDCIVGTVKNVTMEKKKNAIALREIGYENFLSSLSELPNYNNEYDMGKLKYSVVCPTAVNPIGKEWQEERFAEIVKYFNDLGLKTVIVGTEKERLRKSKLFEELEPGTYIDLMGKTNIKQFIAVIQQAQIVVGNDSSCIHIAAASKVRSVCILSGFNATRAFPYEVEKESDSPFLPHTLYAKPICEDCSIKNVKKYEMCCKSGQMFRCLDDITADEVKREIDKICFELKAV